MAIFHLYNVGYMIQFVTFLSPIIGGHLCNHLSSGHENSPGPKKKLTENCQVPGDSMRDRFGMVSSRDPFKWLSDLQRSGMKRARIESPGV